MGLKEGRQGFLGPGKESFPKHWGLVVSGDPTGRLPGEVSACNLLFIVIHDRADQVQIQAKGENVNPKTGVRLDLGLKVSI